MSEFNIDITCYAFRYALGRKSYAVGIVCQYLKDHWKELPMRIREQIQSEIKTAIEKSDAGMDMDVKSWKEISELRVK